MTLYHSDVLHAAQARGFIHQGTDLTALDQLMKKECVPAYLGFDATATGPSQETFDDTLMNRSIKLNIKTDFEIH